MSRSSTPAMNAFRQRTQLVNRQQQNQLSYRARQQTWSHNAGASYLRRYVWKSGCLVNSLEFTYVVVPPGA